jgi:vacuolar-type H+-ATPase subunit I/STV1
VVDLVESAADDLGVDLDDIPTASDDEEFEQAPVESPQRRQPAHVMSRRSTTLDPVQEKTDVDNLDSEDNWLQKTRRQLTDLSKARSQLMDELDTIAEDLGVHLDDRRRSFAEIEPVQRVPQRTVSRCISEMDSSSQVY